MIFKKNCIHNEQFLQLLKYFFHAFLRILFLIYWFLTLV